MDNRKAFFSLVNRETSPVLAWTMAFFNEKLAQKLLGKDSIPGDCIPSKAWKTGASDREDWDKKINYARAAGNFAVGVGWGTNIAFGHGGPGEFRKKMIESGDRHRIYMYETGVKEEVRYDPHFYRHYDFPVKNQEDLKKLVLPDPDHPERYRGIAEEAAYYKQNGFVTYANVNGFFSGIHYFLYPYDDLLADLILEPGFVTALLEKIGEFNLKAAKNLLECGVDIITFCDDLGSGSSLLMSPELYRKFFLPWHKKLAGLCHSYGALLHMHSHGNINEIVGDLYNIGLDMLNPNDPFEGMDLVALKRKYGDRILFVGGLDKFFFEWDFETQKGYVEKLVEETSGGFVIMDSGGVPENVTRESFKRLMELFDRLKNLF